MTMRLRHRVRQAVRVILRMEATHIRLCGDAKTAVLICQYPAARLAVTKGQVPIEAGRRGYRGGVGVGGDHFMGRACAGTTGREARGAAPGEPRDAVRDRLDSPVNSPVIDLDPPVIDEPGFREYVTARSRSLLRTAYLLTGNVPDAEDLVQAALTKTYQAWDRIEDRAALDGYVRRAMVNTHISWWRRRRLEEFPTDEVPDQVVADPCRDSDLQDTLRRAIGRLPQRMRAAVVLRYYEDMTEAEVADVLGVSLGTVKSTVSRAVAKLRIDAELLAD
jgi:RNA polymerase sigma-70 factor (sigma-E family)